jgi:hypothetical protein
MQSGVVAQQNWAVAQVVVQRLAVAAPIVALARRATPGLLGETPAVHEDDDPAGRRRIRRGQIVGRQRHRFTTVSKHHRAGKRVFVVGQVVAVYPVQRGGDRADRVGA